MIKRMVESRGVRALLSISSTTASDDTQDA